MPLREFTDATGGSWRVWDTRPTTPMIRPDYVAGWLTFERLGPRLQRRRLTPIPDGWADLADLELAQLCVRAADDRVRPRLVE